jgi:hypothetical protein
MESGGLISSGAAQGGDRNRHGQGRFGSSPAIETYLGISLSNLITTPILIWKGPSGSPNSLFHFPFLQSEQNERWQTRGGRSILLSCTSYERGKRCRVLSRNLKLEPDGTTWYIRGQKGTTHKPDNCCRCPVWTLQKNLSCGGEMGDTNHTSAAASFMGTTWADENQTIAASKEGTHSRSRSRSSRGGADRLRNSYLNIISTLQLFRICQFHLLCRPVRVGGRESRVLMSFTYFPSGLFPRQL